MKRTRLISLSLCLLLPAFAASCSREPAVSAGTTGAADTEAVSEIGTTERFRRDNLPSDLNLGGDVVTILYRAAMKDEFYADDMNGELVNDAVFQKNSNVEDRLNVKLKYLPNESTDWGGGYQRVISQSVLAGDEAYDIVSGPSFHLPTLILDGCLCNLRDVPYLEFDMPWWTQNLIETTSFGDKLFLVSGDISLGMIRYIHCTYFNKTVTDGQNLGDMYKYVFDGEWTITKLQELCAGLYSDLNGDGAVSLGTDKFGYIITSTTLWRAYIDALGINYVYINKAGVPEFNFADARAIAACELFTKLLNKDNPDIRLGDGNETTYKIFTENRAAFVIGRLIDSETAYREMEDDYGILPFPNWDEAQEEYKVTICGSESTFGIPVNSGKTKTLGAVMEALASESYRSVTPVYYESALKVKYTRDDTVSQVIDIIKGGAVFNPTVQMSKLLGRTDYFVIECASGGTSLVSAFAANESRLRATLKEVLEKIG